MDMLDELLLCEKMFRFGIVFFSDVELLVFFLCIGMLGKDVMMLVKEILQYFGLLYGLLLVDFVQFCGVNGIGLVKFVQLKGIVELVRCYYSVCMNEESVLLSLEMMWEFL